MQNIVQSFIKNVREQGKIDVRMGNANAYDEKLHEQMWELKCANKLSSQICNKRLINFINSLTPATFPAAQNCK